MGRLEVRVCGARSIGDVQKVGTPDPYIKIKLGENKKTCIKYKTRVVENNLNPTWNELFKFQIADYDRTQLLFELWNDNVVVDDLMGSYRLSLNGLKRGVVEDMWVILTGTKLSSAELHLRVLAVDFGRDPAPGDTVVSSIEQDNYVIPSTQMFRPPKKNYPDPSLYPAALQMPPQTVVYGPQYTNPSTAPIFMGHPQPVYSAPQPIMYNQPQPAYYAPPAPPPLMFPPPPQPMYAPPPVRQPNQYAYGVPPDM